MQMRYLLPISLALVAAGCGEDEPTGAPPPPKAGAAAPGKAGGKPTKPPPNFTPRVRVEDRVLNPDEKKGIRHVFKERDFAVEQSNRDPFQSFVLNQGIVGPTSDNKLPRDITKKCTRDDQMVATNYRHGHSPGRHRRPGHAAQGADDGRRQPRPHHQARRLRRPREGGREGHRYRVHHVPDRARRDCLRGRADW